MLTEGMFVGDRYEIVNKIGTGGMSDVYKAKDHTLGRFVAIKVLKPEFSEDVNFVTKFRTEAQSAAGLEHPNIVNIYDVGSENGMHYIVMEYVEGITLKTYIEKKGQLTFKEAVSIAIQVGRGIEAAHNKGIIHRDIKPQNIIISTEGKVKVTDFGIARAATSNTISSDVMGSVHYASPEQARNGFVDGKSDIYSLGIVMYEMVTGRVPFDGDTTVAVAIQHLQEEIVPPSAYAPNLPISMEKIILKCTQKNPDRRYESMTALLADLRKALISPNEDFVVIAPVSQEKTRVIGEEEINKIKQETSNIYLSDEDVVSHNQNHRDKFEKRDRFEEDDEDDEEAYDDDELEEMNPKMDKAITIMQFKLEGQLIKEHPEFEMEKRLLLDKINIEKGTVCVEETEYPLKDVSFPTIDWEDPYRLSEDEADVMERLVTAFVNCEKLQRHVRFLYTQGSLYKVYNGNLLYHGCIPLNANGGFKEVQVYGKLIKARHFMIWRVIRHLRATR